MNFLPSLKAHRAFIVKCSLELSDVSTQRISLAFSTFWKCLYFLETHPVLRKRRLDVARIAYFFIFFITQRVYLNEESTITCKKIFVFKKLLRTTISSFQFCYSCIIQVKNMQLAAIVYVKLVRKNTNFACLGLLTLFVT